MAKLTLVKARIISSKEELMAFKKESTAALLSFAESNDCDLEAISAALTKKYAEIDQALNEGYKVESEIEIHPQPAPPATPEAAVDKLNAEIQQLLSGATEQDHAEIERRVRLITEKVKQQELLMPEIHGLPGTAHRKTACMRPPATAYHVPGDVNVVYKMKHMVNNGLAAMQAAVDAWVGSAKEPEDAKKFHAAAASILDPILDIAHAHEKDSPYALQESGYYDLYNMWKVAYANVIDYSTDSLTGKLAARIVARTAAISGDPIHPALPVQQDEGNPEAQDPADLVEAQQERELAESRITMEDIAKLMAEAPDKQPIASEIVAAAPQIGQVAAFKLLAGLAYDRYTSAELLTMLSSLRIIAADEGEDVAEATPAEEAAGEDVPHAPGKSQEQLTIEQNFSEGAFKAINDMVSKFNKLMDEVDPEMQLLPPITVEEIVRRMNIDKRRDRSVSEEFATPTGINPAVLDRYVLPSLNALAPEDKVAALEGFSRADIDKAIDQWYGDNGLNPIDDMISGVEQYLQANKLEGFTGKQIVDQFLASEPEGHITVDGITSVIGELRRGEKERTDLAAKQEAEARGAQPAPAPAPEQPAAQPAAEPAPAEAQDKKEDQASE